MTIAETLQARALARQSLHERQLARENSEQTAARVVGSAIMGYALWLEHAPLDVEP